jgi:hypothetical protein
MAEGLPPIHDLVRFWHRSSDATLGACVQFRRKPLPGWTLGWLRQAAPIIMIRGLSETALRHAVREKVFQEGQASVLKAVELFVEFAEAHQWSGNSLSPSFYELPSGAKIRTAAIGRYFSKKTEKEWLVALQPRQNEIPNDEQFAMWRSVLCYEYEAADDRVMIVDISKNPVSQKRELREITSRKFPMISKSILDDRLDLVASCYRKAIEIVPERPQNFSKGGDPTLL